MKKIIRILTIGFVVASLSACSLAPGIPGLKINKSRYSSNSQKEGVDYKVVLINVDTIRKQKPFDYLAFVKAKKQRASLYKLKPNKNGTVKGLRDVNKQLMAQKTNIKKTNYSQLQSDVANSSPLTLFEGISVKDNKANYQYFIGKSDVLNITVWDHPELTSPSENNSYGGHVVGSDGRFYFPYSGKIKALGKTIESIRDELESKLGSFITKPQVSVSITHFRSQKIYTSGAVVTPLTLAINDIPTTVRDAISKSGGLTPNRYTGYATLARNGKNISIDLNRMLKHNDNRQNFILKDGDRLNVVEKSELGNFNRALNFAVHKANTMSSVQLRNEIRSLQTLNPLKLKFELEKERSIARLKKELGRELRSEQAKVFVMGEVAKPGSIKYQVEDGMTLAEAINDSGSFKEESVNPTGVFVVRRESVTDIIPTVYQLPIASVQSMFLAEQFEIRPRDIVYITAKPSIRWNRVVSLLLPSLAILNTYRNIK